MNEEVTKIEGATIKRMIFLKTPIAANAGEGLIQ